MKKRSILAVGLLLALALTACGSGGVTTFDATNYMQGLMDETYLGKFHEDYMKSVGTTEEEAQANYEMGLEAEYSYFSANFEFDEECITDQTRQATIDLLAAIYQYSKYQVKPATKIDGGYSVEIVVEPIDLIPLVVDQYMEEYSINFNARYENVTQETLDAMTEAEVDAFWVDYGNAWAQGIVDLFNEHMEELGHLKAQSILVQFKPDADGYYTISDNDFANLDALVLAYSY